MLLGLDCVIWTLMDRMHCLFFFQAEDGIRDRNVTGVQTCALPICAAHFPAAAASATFAAPPSMVSAWVTRGWAKSARIVRPSSTLFPSRRTTSGLVADRKSVV